MPNPLKFNVKYNINSFIETGNSKLLNADNPLCIIFFDVVSKKFKSQKQSRECIENKAKAIRRRARTSLKQLDQYNDDSDKWVKTSLLISPRAAIIAEQKIHFLISHSKFIDFSFDKKELISNEIHSDFLEAAGTTDIPNLLQEALTNDPSFIRGIKNLISAITFTLGNISETSTKTHYQEIKYDLAPFLHTLGLNNKIGFSVVYSQTPDLYYHFKKVLIANIKNEWNLENKPSLELPSAIKKYIKNAVHCLRTKYNDNFIIFHETILNTTHPLIKSKKCFLASSIPQKLPNELMQLLKNIYDENPDNFLDKIEKINGMYGDNINYVGELAKLSSQYQQLKQDYEFLYANYEILSLSYLNLLQENADLKNNLGDQLFNNYFNLSSNVMIGEENVTTEEAIEPTAKKAKLEIQPPSPPTSPSITNFSIFEKELYEKDRNGLDFELLRDDLNIAKP